MIQGFPSGSSSSAERFGLTVNASLAVMLAGLWFYMGWLGLFWRADFRAFYTGWTMVLEGQGANLYDLALQDTYQARVLPERPEGEGLLPFVNPPHTALVLAPLAFLSRSAAFAVWTLFQVGLCGLAGSYLLRLGRVACPDRTWLLLVTVLAFPPVFVSFQLGQVSLLCFVCLLGFVCALKDDRPFWVACWIVVGTIKPQLVVMPCVILVALRRWRDLAWVIGLFSIWAVATGVILGWASWAGFVAVIRFSSQQFSTSGIDPLVMYNLKGSLTSALGRQQAQLVNALTVAAWLLAVVFVLGLWRKRSAREGTDFDLRLALSLLVGILVNPHLNPADAIVLVVPMILFLGHLRRFESPVQTAFLATLLVCCPFLFLVDCYLVNPEILGARPFFLLMVAVMVWMGWVLARRDGIVAQVGIRDAESGVEEGCALGSPGT